MATWIVLLRGVNVGGANKLSMAALRDVMSDLGHSSVSTYIQSGNVVITSDRDDRSGLATEICAAITASFGLAVSAVLRTPDELRAALDMNPFTTVEGDARVLITFLSDKPTAADVAKLDAERFAPDRFEVVGSELYGYYAHGSGRSKMTLDYFEKSLHVKGTSRNLNTVAKLIELSTR
ncbi:MAG TPA: DUF1697 domain-containing protein [Ilumatobacteraceae bacterium]